VLADSGYYSAEAVAAVEDGGEGPTVYAAVKRHPHGRTVEQREKREKREDPPPPRDSSPLLGNSFLFGALEGAVEGIGEEEKGAFLTPAS
jgi:hypothetical protein